MKQLEIYKNTKHQHQQNIYNEQEKFKVASEFVAHKHI